MGEIIFQCLYLKQRTYSDLYSIISKHTKFECISNEHKLLLKNSQNGIMAKFRKCKSKSIFAVKS